MADPQFSSLEEPLARSLAPTTLTVEADPQKRFSDHFADAELEAHPHDEEFDFGSNLQTHDSVSSLNELGSDQGNGDTSETTALVAGPWETFGENGQNVVIIIVNVLLAL